MIGVLLAAGLFVQTPPPQADLLAVSFHSHLCGPCLILDIRMDPVEADYAQMPVRFVRLDQTFGQARARRQAEALGLESVYAEAGGPSGFILLVDQSSGDVLDRLTIAQDETEIRQRLARALHFAGQSD